MCQKWQWVLTHSCGHTDPAKPQPTEQEPVQSRKRRAGPACGEALPARLSPAQARALSDYSPTGFRVPGHKGPRLHQARCTPLNNQETPPDTKLSLTDKQEYFPLLISIKPEKDHFHIQKSCFMIKNFIKDAYRVVHQSLIVNGLQSYIQEVTELLGKGPASSLPIKADRPQHY